MTAEITATDGQPFWVPGVGEWIAATDLTSGQWLRTSSGSYVQISSVERWTAQGATVHKPTVSNVHTYYVVAAGASALVHGCGPSRDNEGDGLTPENPAFDGDPYSERARNARSDARNAHFANYQDLTRQLDRLAREVANNPGARQRMNPGPDNFGNFSNVSGLGSWVGSPIFDGENIGLPANNQLRVMLNLQTGQSRGSRARNGVHDYNRPTLYRYGRRR
ncbi:hypothetical protein RB628_40025 [Streptomyces sp. ADMS]|uniref:hypothetical protein n=1 Tax=Streptomyces sp. ADMS TaxID=3071415 RepID=UPI00296E5EC0|nr:hypothetical protein [Streptomyces sp. ADMS]MDW4911318.1 hypothetical protein [Streptomyces sp. ADMS]